MGAADTTGAIAEAGTGAAGFSSAVPHVMQNRMPGALAAPQRPHFVPSAGTGGIGTPMGGVGGAMRAAKRAPQSSQKTR